MGYMINKMHEMVPKYGNMCYDDKTIVNIFYLTNLVKKYIVKYDSHLYYDIVVHNNRGIAKFRITKLGLNVINSTYTTAN